MKKIYVIVVVLMALLPFASIGQSSIATLGTPVLEDFTGYLGAAAPTNWSTAGTGSVGNTFQGTNQVAGASGGWYGNNNMSYLGSGNASNGNATWKLQNNTGSTITALNISFVARMWKSGTNSPTVSLTYSTNSTGTVPAPGVLTAITTFSDATPNIATGTTLSNTISSISIPNGDYLFIRFLHSGGTSSDNLGWDDVSITGTGAVACTTPTIQASLLTFSGITPTQQTLNFTRGDGTGGVLVIGKNGSVPTDPSSGTAYAGNLAYASGDPVGTGYAVYNGAGAGTSTATSHTVTSLTAETQYFYNFYEWNTTSTCYNQAELSGNAWTLSLEPTDHSATFTNSVIAYNQIDLTYAVPSGVGADGYVILRRADGTNPDIAGVTDGVAPGSWTLPVGTTLVNANATGTTYNNTGLSGSTNYCYLLIPFNWNGANPQTYNYRTAATVPTTCAGTPAGPSSASDIVFNSVSAVSNNSNIAYASYQSGVISNTGSGPGGSAGVMAFTVRDGGAAANDLDALPTILTAISFNVTNAANIRSAALFSGSTFIANVAVAGTSPIVFTGLSGADVTCGDNATLALSLRVTFNATVTDNQQMQYTIASATAAGGNTSSLFAAADAGGAASSIVLDINRFEVTADQLRFSQQPVNITTAANMSPSPTVETVDALFNRDLDINIGTVSITSSGTLSATPQNATPVAGLATFATISHTVGGTGLLLTATYAGLTTIVSNAFNITTFTFVNGDYRPSFDFADFSMNGSWEVYSAGTWTGGQTAPQNLAVASRPARIIIDRPGIGGAGNASNAYKTIIVTSGGSLDLLNNASPSADFITSGNSLEIQAGGQVTLTGQININSGANFIIRSGGTFILNNVNIGNSHGFWAGVENFEPGSSFNITNHNNGGTGAASLINVYNQIDDNATGAKFGNLNINFNPSTSNWTIVGGPISLILCDNLSVANGNATNTITMFSNNGSPSATIRGNVTHSSGIFALSGDFSGITTAQTLNIDGNLISSAGTLKTYFNGGSGIPANININLKGNLSVSGAAFLSDVNNTTKLNFTNNVLQTISIIPACSFINIIAKTGSVVQLQNQDLNFSGSSLFTVESGALFDFGFNGTTALRVNVSAGVSNTFTSASGSYLKITSPLGLNVNAGELGNVEGFTTTGRAINTLGTFHYIGKSNQVTGNAVSTSSNARTVICDLTDNAKELTFTNSTSITTTGALDIRSGRVIESTTAYLSGSTGQLKMSGGTMYKIAKGNSTAAASIADPLPRLSGTYTLSGGTIELAGSGTSDAFQTMRGGRTYKYLSFSGANTLGTDFKNMTSNVTVDSAVIVSGTAVVDCKDGAPSAVSFTGAGGINMTGGRMRFLNSSTAQPQLTGVNSAYDLSGGVMEFYASAGGTQTINGNYGSVSTPIEYSQIEITGNNVGQSSDNITLRSGGAFTVKNGGIFQMTSRAIVGPSGTQTVAVETGGTFRCANPLGFYGATVLTNSPSVRDNIETVTLQTNSTVEYARQSGALPPSATSGDQAITAADGASAAYQNLTLAGDGIKTAPSGTLIVQGNLAKTGTPTFAPNNGLVLLNGAAQSFAGLDFSRLELSGSGTKTTAGGKATIDSLLQINDPVVLAISNNDSISILSTASRTARVAQINHATPANAITYGTNSKFIVHRYIRSGRKWRFLSVPTDDNNQSFKSSWQEGATSVSDNPIANYGTIIGDNHTLTYLANGFDTYTPGGGSVKYLNPAGTANIGIPSTNSKIQLLGLGNFPAFFAFIAGDRSVTTIGSTSSTTLRTKGKLFVGDQSVTVGAGEIKGIGNPFASPLNMISALGAIPGGTIPGLVPTYQVWDPQGTGTYGFGFFQVMTWDSTNFTVFPGLGSYGPQLSINNSIESGIGFYVKGTTGATLNIGEAAKTPAAVNQSFTSGIPERLIGNLYAEPTSAPAVMVDAFMINYSSGYSNNINSDDIDKMTNTGENAGIKSSDKKLIIEKRAPVADKDTVHIELSNLRIQNYHWEIISDNLDYPGRTGFLIDRYTNTTSPLNMAGTTTVNFNVENVAASYAADRFIIVFRQPDGGPLPVTITAVSATRKEDKTIAVQWKVENETNISSYEVERSADGSSFTGIHNRLAQTNNGGRASYDHIDLLPGAGDNFYRIKATSIGGQVQYSTIVKVAAIKQLPSISLYPNPVEGRDLQVRFVGQPAGKYSVQVSNAAGQVIYRSAVTVSSALQTLPVSLPAKTAAGAYQLKVVAADGSATVEQLLLK